MNYILLLFLSFYHFAILCQRPPDFCEIDIQKPCEITCLVVLDSTKADVKYTISNINKRCDGQVLILDSNLNKMYFRNQYCENWNFFFKDSIRYYVDTFRVIQWTFNFHNPYKIKFDVSKLDPFYKFKITNLQYVKIINNAERPSLNLKKWSIIKKINECDSLKQFYVQTTSEDYLKNNKKYINLQYDYKQLHSLNYRYDFDYSSFEKLEYFDVSNESLLESPIRFFDLRVLQIPKLKQPIYTFNNGSSKNYTSDEFYSEKYFFFQELNHNAHCDPINIVDSLIKLKKLTSNSRQKLLILNKDLYSYSKFPEDTIACGFIENNEMIGLWRFYFPYMYNNDTIFFDFSREKVALPENGNWIYYYHTGKKAIEGSFENGKKEGEWRFYNLDGSVSYIKNFKKNLPRGFFAKYYNNVPFIRYYYINSSKYLLSGNCIFDQKTRNCNIYTQAEHLTVLKGKNYFYVNDTLTVVKNNILIKTIPKGSKRYNRIVKKKLVNRLFPEIKQVKS